jgi:hypothetical protein
LMVIVFVVVLMVIMVAKMVIMVVIIVLSLDSVITSNFCKFMIRILQCMYSLQI